MLTHNEHSSVIETSTFAAHLLLVEHLQHTRFGFTAQVAKPLEAFFIWIRTSLLINGKRDWKFNGLLHLNQFVEHRLIVLAVLIVHLLLEMAALAAFATRATTGIEF